MTKSSPSLKSSSSSTSMEPQITVLPNGLRVVTQSVPHVETVAMGVWVDVGSRHETPQINGISHLLEHMAFKGTETRSARDIAETIEAVGGHVNAHTSREHTAYTVRVLKEDLELGIDILSDILQNSTFEQEELDREKGVVAQEIYRSHDTPDDIIFDYYKEVAYPDQAVGRPILGSLETVQSISREDLFAYMQTYYSPHKMVVSVAGNVSHDAVVDLATRYFSKLKKADAPEPESLQYKGGTNLVNRDLEQIHMVLGFKGYGYGTDAFYTASVLSVILSGGMSSRLFQEIREKRGLVYAISTFNISYKEGGLFNLYAGTSAEHMDELLPAIQKEFQAITKTVQKEELNRARSQFKAALMMGAESMSSCCERLATHILHYGRVLPMAEVIGKIESITSQDIKSISQELFTTPPTFAAIGNVEGIDTSTF